MGEIKVCSICGFKIEKDGKVGDCLKCCAEYSKFVELSEEDAKKIYMSDRTNDIHCKLIDIAMQMAILAEEGAKINLDLGCLDIFHWLKDRSWDLKQLCKAELETHMKKGKW